MFDKPALVLWLLGVVVVIAAFYGLRHRFGSNVKEARRRARNYGPVVSRKRQPAVKLAVNVDERKSSRKR